MVLPQTVLGKCSRGADDALEGRGQETDDKSSTKPTQEGHGQDGYYHGGIDIRVYKSYPCCYDPNTENPEIQGIGMQSREAHIPGGTRSFRLILAGGKYPGVD